MAESEANQVLPAQAAVPDRKKNGKKKLVVAVILLAGIGFGVWRIFLQPRRPISTDPSSISPTKTVLTLESFTVNLADPEDGRFLRATLSLGVDGQPPVSAKGNGKEGEAGAVSMATIRDSILTVLTQCKSGDLLTPEGKLKLKADLINALKRDAPALQAREVYFTEFLVQR
jgi:flagellar FliL protein